MVRKHSRKASKTKVVDTLSWVKRGKQRRDIIMHIHDTQTPTEIAKEAGYSLNHTSRILGEFRKEGLVKLLNPKAKTGRLYEITPQGKVIKDKLVSSKRKNKDEYEL